MLGQLGSKNNLTSCSHFFKGLIFGNLVKKKFGNSNRSQTRYLQFFCQDYLKCFFWEVMARILFFFHESHQKNWWKTNDRRRRRRQQTQKEKKIGRKKRAQTWQFEGDWKIEDRNWQNLKLRGRVLSNERKGKEKKKEMVKRNIK